MRVLPKSQYDTADAIAGFVGTWGLLLAMALNGRDNPLTALVSAAIQVFIG